jgi:hypothetical protein
MLKVRREEPAMVFQVCPMHTLEEVRGAWVSDDVGWSFTCPLPHDPTGVEFTWLAPPEIREGREASGVAEEFGLWVEIPAVLKQFSGTWVEYGVFERAYATSHDRDWLELVDRYGHTARAAKRYTVSAFLAATLGSLARSGALGFHSGPATGRWDYNSVISYWALPPEPDWGSRLSWVDSGADVSYVPGQVEV